MTVLNTLLVLNVFDAGSVQVLPSINENSEYHQYLVRDYYHTVDMNETANLLTKLNRFVRNADPRSNFSFEINLSDLEGTSPIFEWFLEKEYMGMAVISTELVGNSDAIESLYFRFKEPEHAVEFKLRFG